MTLRRIIYDTSCPACYGTGQNRARTPNFSTARVLCGVCRGTGLSLIAIHTNLHRKVEPEAMIQRLRALDTRKEHS